MLLQRDPVRYNFVRKFLYKTPHCYLHHTRIYTSTNDIRKTYQ
jgi:hypothetical protein